MDSTRYRVFKEALLQLCETYDVTVRASYAGCCGESALEILDGFAPDRIDFEPPPPTPEEMAQRRAATVAWEQSRAREGKPPGRSLQEIFPNKTFYTGDDK